MDNKPEEHVMPDITEGIQELHDMKTTDDNNSKKSAKDFTPEEAKRLLERVKEVGISRTARETGITAAVIIALRRKAIIKAALEEKAHAAAIPIPLHAKTPIDEQEKPVKIKRSRDFTTEEKAKIVARSRFVGAAQAAREAGITVSMIYNWTFQLKTEGAKSPQVEKLETKPQIKQDEPTTIKTEEVKATTPETHEIQPKEHPSALEIENIILKEKVRYLTEQAERLKIAITALMGEAKITL